MRPPHEQLELLRRRAAEIISEDELLERLREGRPLRVKYGIDPTGPDVHLGHTVPLRVLRQFQELGHLPVLIIGDFTARIGDPSGRTESRPQLTREQVEQNLAGYKEQLFKIIDPGWVELRYNSEWLSALSTEQILRLAATHTVAQLLAREDFGQRYRSQAPIGLHEFLYPLFQGYDSVAVQADVELGATEQKFNFLVARELQRANPLGPSQPPQVIVTLPILVGTDGVQRMGKSLDNYIGVNSPPDDMFGQVMSIPDSVIGQYYELITDVPEAEIAARQKAMAAGELNPRDAKLRLAELLVRQFHGAAAARGSAEHWEQVFVGEEIVLSPSLEAEITRRLSPEHRGQTVWITRALVLAGLAPSNSEARRLVQAGAVYADDRRIADPEHNVVLQPGLFLRVGKRRLAKIAFE